MIRAKNWLYDSGTRIPLVIYYPPQVTAPERFERGGASGRLISTVDVVAETLMMAGGEVPDWMQGRSFLRDDSTSREYLMTAADIMGDVETCSRAVRTERYKYIRNFKRPGSINACTTAYRRAMHPLYHLINIMGERQLLTKPQAQLLEPLGEEELYDVEADPHETINLIGQKDHAAAHRQLRSVLTQWIDRSGDQGVDGVNDELRRAVESYRATTFKKQSRRIAALRDEVESHFTTSSP